MREKVHVKHVQNYHYCFLRIVENGGSRPHYERLLSILLEGKILLERILLEGKKLERTEQNKFNKHHGTYGGKNQ